VAHGHLKGCCQNIQDHELGQCLPISPLMNEIGLILEWSISKEDHALKNCSVNAMVEYNMKYVGT
jgi:hypothetical protein